AHAGASSEVLTDLGRALQLAGDPSAAEHALRRAVAEEPVAPEAYLQLAALAGRANRAHEARDALVRYALLVGDSRPIAGVATQIAEYAIRLGDAAQALRWIARAADEGGESRALA